MRLGVLDIGSNSMHLRIVELNPEHPPRTIDDVRHRLRLAEATGADGMIGAPAVRRLLGAAAEAVATARVHQVDDVTAFATSAIRDAANGREILAQLRDATGINVVFLTGEDEARLTFLAARRWFGWSAGRLLLLDIGGGSLEIAAGQGQDTDFQVSLPLGAGRLTRHHLPGDSPVKTKHVKKLRNHVRAALGTATERLAAGGEPAFAVGTSKTLYQLARLTGAPSRKAGLYTTRVLERAELREWIPRLAERSTRERSRLPGISESRAPQILAGAIVAESAMALLGVDRLRICPWALREGVMLHRADVLATSGVVRPEELAAAR